MSSSPLIFFLSLLASSASSAWGRSLQEELGGTPEAPFGLSARLVGVGTLEETDSERFADDGDSENRGTIIEQPTAAPNPSPAPNAVSF